jgi:hypothetical protein
MSAIFSRSCLEPVWSSLFVRRQILFNAHSSTVQSHGLYPIGMESPSWSLKTGTRPSPRQRAQSSMLPCSSLSGRVPDVVLRCPPALMLRLRRGPPHHLCAQQDIALASMERPPNLAPEPTPRLPAEAHPEDRAQCPPWGRPTRRSGGRTSACRRPCNGRVRRMACIADRPGLWRTARCSRRRFR